MAKKYISKINKDGTTIYMKDTEAQDAIGQIPSTYATKTELNALLGPTYDEDGEGIEFPITSRTSYDSTEGGIIIE